MTAVMGPAISWLRRFWAPLVLVAAYVGGVSFIGYEITLRQARDRYADKHRVTYLAARTLVANTRLRPEHLIRPRDLPLGYFWYLPKLPQLQGMYLKKDVQPKQSIAIDDVRVWPELPPQKTGRTMALPLQGQPDGDMLNAGAIVDLCTTAGKCVVREAKVQAVICGNASPPACHALVLLPEITVAQVLKAPKLQIVIAAFP